MPLKDRSHFLRNNAIKINNQQNISAFAGSKIMETAIKDKRKQNVSPVFARHETFHPRFGWLKKGFDKAIENPDVFLSEAAPSILGVGKNMVKAIKYWCIAFKVLEEIKRTRSWKTHCPHRVWTESSRQWRLGSISRRSSLTMAFTLVFVEAPMPCNSLVLHLQCLQQKQLRGRRGQGRSCRIQG